MTCNWYLNERILSLIQWKIWLQTWKCPEYSHIPWTILWSTNCDSSNGHHELIDKGDMKQGTSGGKVGVITRHDVWYTFQSPIETCSNFYTHVSTKYRVLSLPRLAKKWAHRGGFFSCTCECYYIKLQSCQVSTKPVTWKHLASYMTLWISSGKYQEN